MPALTARQIEIRDQLETCCDRLIAECAKLRALVCACAARGELRAPELLLEGVDALLEGLAEDREALLTEAILGSDRGYD